MTKNYLSKICKAVCRSRQKSANIEVAKWLHQTEFRNESREYVLNAVQEGKVHELLARGR